MQSNLFFFFCKAWSEFLSVLDAAKRESKKKKKKKEKKMFLETFILKARCRSI